jgi:hypothetical protein
MAGVTENVFRIEIRAVFRFLQEGVSQSEIYAGW